MSSLQPEQVVNSSSECFVTVTFYDQNGALYTPYALSYKIVDLTGGTTVVNWTTLSPSTSSYMLTVTAAQNAMLNAARKTETRQVIFKIQPTVTSTGRYDPTTYTIKNISGVP